MRDARTRRALALATREPAPPPPPDPRIAWAREAPPPRRMETPAPRHAPSAFVPPFAQPGSVRPRDVTVEIPATGEEPAPRATATPDAATPRAPGPLAMPGFLAAGHAARPLGFARAHAAPIVASFVVVGIGLGVSLAMFGAGTPAPTQVAEAKASPEPAAIPVPTTAAPTTTPPTPEPAAAAVAMAAAPAPEATPDVFPEIDADATGEEIDLTAAAVGEASPADIVAIEPVAAAPVSLTTEYIAARPRPRPGALEAVSPGLAATGDAASAAVMRYPDARVIINYPANARGEVAAVTKEVGAAGFPAVRSARVNIDMDRANVRYFHASDADAARALAAATGATARDFTGFTPPPKRGHLELWLAGTSPRQAAAAPTSEDQILGILRDRAAGN